MPLIDVDGVTHAYGQQNNRRVVLHEVSARLAEQRIGIIGANGSGKSTFVRLLNGLILPDQGRVTIEDLDTRKDGRAVRRRVGFCFTDPDAQIVMPTVGEDIAFGLRRRALSKSEVADRVSVALSTYGLQEYADHPAHLLSGGQKQLLALASVLVTKPAILVLDEPTTLLDLRNAAMVAAVVAALSQQVIMVTHHLHLLSGFERVLVFDEGCIVFDGASDAAITYYRELMT